MSRISGAACGSPERMRTAPREVGRRLHTDGVIAGKGLPRINNVVDVINYVSVESRLPIVKFPHDAIRFARKRRERSFLLSCFRVFPIAPHRCNSEELAIENFDLVFRFRSLLGVFPFKE